jgi:hypothetical protein
VITDRQAEDAFEYLRDTTGKIGAARGEQERCEILRKRARKRIFVASKGSVAQRVAVAEIHPDVIEIDDRYIAAVIDYETLRAKRDIQSIALDVWRTESANRRRA